jgi:hypothetical protein
LSWEGKVRNRDRPDWGKLLAALAEGARLGLDKDHCRKLHVIAERLSRGRGRPADPIETQNKAKHLAGYYRLLLLDGALPKNALADTGRVFGATRSAIFAARKRWDQELKKSGFDRMNPALRGLLRERFEDHGVMFRVLKSK